jgi:hypothetical protein
LTSRTISSKSSEDEDEIHAAVNLNIENMPDCVDGQHLREPAPFFEVQKVKSLNVIVESLLKVIHQPIIVDKAVIKEVHVPVKKTVYIKTPPKIIDRLVYINSPPRTQIIEKIVSEPVEKIVEQQVIKEVHVSVKKTVYMPAPFETKIVHQPVIQTVEKPIYIEKIVQQPIEIEKIVEKVFECNRVSAERKATERAFELSWHLS